MPAESERDTRSRLGVPGDAPAVLLFAESSHWDPDWLLTSGEYYSLRIRWILNRALREMLGDRRRVYSIESIFFLKMYWEKNPDRRAAIRALVNEGRLRFSGTGFTQPDTMIPSAEAIIRDFLLGRRWLADNGMEAEPRVAYMTDDFGLSPAFPSILSSLGIEYAAGSRVDGLGFPGAEYARMSKYPLPGSTAELLLKDLASADVVWQAPDGSEVLFHLNPSSYGQGDLIALRGPARWMGINVGVPCRSERHVAKRIASYVGQLAPLSRTPYMFCPIGFDFNSPIRDLPALLDRYNRVRYPETGVYTALGCLEDYMDLVSRHSDKLPRVALDPNPNFMGFYFSRPKLKKDCRDLVSTLLTAEKLSFLAGPDAVGAREPGGKAARAWEMAVVTNHHDFVTGTSPDRVYEKEQVPWVARANLLAREALEDSLAAVPDRQGAPAAGLPGPCPAWSLEGGVLKVESPHYSVELDARTGGCMTSYIDIAVGRQVLSGPGNDLLLYEDSGGLWRMGCEFNGGRFRQAARSSRSAASLAASEEGGVLKVKVVSRAGPIRATRVLWFSSGSPLIWMRTIASPGDYRTLTCRFATAFRPESISMDVAGGVVERPLHKTFEPTFWSAQSFVHYRDAGGEAGLALFTGIPATVQGRQGGDIEWVVARNAPRERAFGLMPLPSHPARGRDRSAQVVDYAVCATGPGGWRENRLHVLAGEAICPAWRNPRQASVEELARSAVTVDNEDVRVMSVKPASRGEGWIVRLLSYAGEPVTVRLEAGPGPIRRASLCDALERDLRPAEIENGRAVVPAAQSITSVRFILGSDTMT